MAYRFLPRAGNDAREQLDSLISTIAETSSKDILDHVDNVRALLDIDPPAVELALATAWMVEAAAAEKFRRYIGDAQRGASILAGAKTGHEVTHGTAAQKQARYAAYQRTVELLLMKNPHIKSWRRLSGLAGRRHGCSGRTIRRHVDNPLKSRDSAPHCPALNLVESLEVNQCGKIHGRKIHR